jgi:hypothetical protein
MDLQKRDCAHERPAIAFEVAGRFSKGLLEPLSINVFGKNCFALSFVWLQRCSCDLLLSQGQFAKGLWSSLLFDLVMWSVVFGALCFEIMFIKVVVDQSRNHQVIPSRQGPQYCDYECGEKFAVTSSEHLGCGRPFLVFHILLCLRSCGNVFVSLFLFRFEKPRKPMQRRQSTTCREKTKCVRCR